MSEQLAIILRRDGDGWTMYADVGEPGLEHARRLRLRKFPVRHANLSLALGLLAADTEDSELVSDVRKFVGPWP